MRNFTVFCAPGILCHDIVSYKRVLEKVKEQLAEVTKKENLDGSATGVNNLVRLLHYIPLGIKRLVIYLITRLSTRKMFTTTLTNIGVVDMPDGMEQHVEKMDVIMNSSNRFKVVCALISLGDTAMLTLTKNIRNDTFENALYRQMTQAGLEIEITGSETY
jgi:hypothetical protein